MSATDNTGVRWRRINQALIGMLALLAVVWTVVSVRQASGVASREPTEPEGLVPGWRTFTVGGQRLGSPTAQAVAVIFVDYACAACADAYHRLRVMQTEVPTKLTIIVRQNPLGSNPFTAMAARAAICAANQRHFWSFNDFLFSNAKLIGRNSWQQVAERAGVADIKSFSSCLSDSATISRVRADRTAARALHYSLSPLLLINGETYNGTPWDLERIVAHHLTK